MPLPSETRSDSPHSGSWTHVRPLMGYLRPEGAHRQRDDPRVCLPGEPARASASHLHPGLPDPPDHEPANRPRDCRRVARTHGREPVRGGFSTAARFRGRATACGGALASRGIDYRRRGEPIITGERIGVLSNALQILLPAGEAVLRSGDGCANRVLTRRELRFDRFIALVSGVERRTLELEHSGTPTIRRFAAFIENSARSRMPRPRADRRRGAKRRLPGHEPLRAHRRCPRLSRQSRTILERVEHTLGRAGGGCLSILRRRTLRSELPDRGSGVPGFHDLGERRDLGEHQLEQVRAGDGP